MVETPSRVTEGPEVAIEALAEAFAGILARTGVARERVRAVGLDTPGPASANGVISARGSTNFAHAGWRGFDFRGALEARLGLPVDLQQRRQRRRPLRALRAASGRWRAAARRSPPSWGPGSGAGSSKPAASSRAPPGSRASWATSTSPWTASWAKVSPFPAATAASPATSRAWPPSPAIEHNLLPYWLTRFPGHELGEVGDLAKAAKLVRSYGEKGDPLARQVFEQQAKAIGRLFTIAANFTDPDAYFVGGGVVESAPEFRDWFLAKVRENTTLKEEQARVAQVRARARPRHGGRAWRRPRRGARATARKRLGLGLATAGDARSDAVRDAFAAPFGFAGLRAWRGSSWAR